MVGYIERNWLYDQMNSTGQEFSLLDALEMIEKFPAADVAPVRHGRWIHKNSPYDENIYICTACKEQVSILGDKLRYCPDCGAMMDGDDGDA